MTVELISVTAVLAGGTALVFALGIRGCALPALGLVAGLALQIICGAIQVVTGLPTTPALTLTLVVLLPAGWWIWSGRRNNGLAVPVKTVLAVLLLVVVVVIALYGAGLVNLTPDSYQYLSTGSLLESGHLDAAPPERLLERSLAVPLIHAPANLAGAFYLRSITPLLALAALITLGWICREGLRVSLEDSHLIFYFSAAAVLWILSSHRFVYHAFYVNGHTLSAVLLLLLAGCGWLYARGAALPPRALF
ncbi:MAG TPA: hypothetical protein PLY40_09870, partial [Bacillota bacterium]|nr:hypothetical protein [Bacillota bacterium]